jgi:hypothetical protein
VGPIRQTLFALARYRSLCVVGLMAARVALTNASGFAAKSSQVIELGPADATSFDQIDVIDYGCVQWKDSFHANSETRLSDSDRFARAAMFAGDHHALKSLQSLFGLGFLNPHVNADRIAWLKLWNIITQLGLFNLIQSIHFLMLLI